MSVLSRTFPSGVTLELEDEELPETVSVTVTMRRGGRSMASASYAAADEEERLEGWGDAPLTVPLSKTQLLWLRSEEVMNWLQVVGY